MNVKKILHLIKSHFFPSEQELMVKKYFADGGDYKFRFDYNLNEDSIVFDCGGFEGQWTSDLYARYNCKVYVFEPVFSFYENIKNRFQNNNQIKVFNYGLGMSTRKEKIHISANSSSIFGSEQDCEEIEILNIEKWIHLKGINTISLLKVNIEGGEYELFDKLIESNLIEIIDNIQVQFHDIDKNANTHMEKIIKSLHATHRPTYQYKFVWENWTRRVK